MVRVAIVGLGWWGRILASTIRSQSKKLKVVRFVDLRPDRAGTFPTDFGVPMSANLGDALADSHVDAIVLATPHGGHAEQISAVAAAGKHVFCEKPLGLTEASVRSSIKICRDAGVVLGVGHERRFEPPIRDLLRWLRSGELGVPLQIEANFSHDRFLSLPRDNWRLSSHEAPAAGMTGPGIHLVDLAVMLLGQARNVVAHASMLASDLPTGDTLSALIQHESKATTYLSATLATPFISRFALYGSKGWVEIRDKAHVESPEGWWMQRQLASSALERTEYDPGTAVCDNLDAFGSAVEGNAAYPIGANDMIATAAAMDAIFRSAAAHGRPVIANPLSTAP